jgi:hypothetical protein
MVCACVCVCVCVGGLVGGCVWNGEKGLPQMKVYRKSNLATPIVITGNVKATEGIPFTSLD